MVSSLEDASTDAAAIDAVRLRWGGLHALINNAVRWPSGFRTVAQLSPEEWRTPVFVFAVPETRPNTSRFAFHRPSP